jgi:hypothetical protein
MARLARAMHEFSPKIYDIPRVSAARARCASFLPVNSTVYYTKFSVHVQVQLYMYIVY